MCVGGSTQGCVCGGSAVCVYVCNNVCALTFVWHSCVCVVMLCLC